ncbi:MAG TPA: FAD-binding oxidoreductase [Acidimicrobiia bacterium]|nr:FAD-binding oxidoreductase [Acidimicrobiia bacterium]
MSPPLTVSFWTEDRPRSDQLAAGSNLPADCDVAIVGSGITGLAAARRFRAAGKSVVVLDSLELAGGASAVNGGMVIYGLKASARSVFANYPPALAQELWDASMRAIDVVEEVASGIDCDFSRSGSLELGYNERDVGLLREEQAWHRQATGLDLMFHSGNEMRSVIGSDRFSGALTEPTSAGVHPARYTFGLAEQLLEAGASLVPHAPVESIERSGSRFSVRTGRGMLAAPQVLVATNGYTGHLVPGLRRGVIPIGSYSAVTEPLPPELAERLIPGNRMAWTARRLLNYFRRTPDNRILMGGRRNMSPDLDLLESGRDLGRRIVEFFPELEDVPITHVWNGRLAATFDLMPHIGTIDGIWYTLGYGGHGLGLGTYLGDEVARLMIGEIDRSPFAEIGHPHRWYYRSRPWFLPAAAAGYRILDRFSR